MTRPAPPEHQDDLELLLHDVCRIISDNRQFLQRMAEDACEENEVPGEEMSEQAVDGEFEEL